jgi:hypothetical protein
MAYPTLLRQRSFSKTQAQSLKELRTRDPLEFSAASLSMIEDVFLGRLLHLRDGTAFASGA